MKLFGTTMELSHVSRAAAACCRVACFSLRQPPSLWSSLPFLLPRPRALTHLGGYEQDYFKHVLYATLPPLPPPPLFSLAITLFSFVQPIFLCAVWFTQAWETCDHSAGYQELQAASVFGGGERRNKENNLTKLADYQDILYDLRTCRFCQKMLITLNEIHCHINYSTLCDFLHLGGYQYWTKDAFHLTSHKLGCS